MVVVLTESEKKNERRCVVGSLPINDASRFKVIRPTGGFARSSAEENEEKRIVLEMKMVRQTDCAVVIGQFQLACGERESSVGPLSLFSLLVTNVREVVLSGTLLFHPLAHYHNNHKPWQNAFPNS